MSTNPSNNSQEPRDLRPWKDCDLFCIRNYAGTDAEPCGWRGRFHETVRDATDTRLLCPRCGSPTLLRIPLDRAEESEGI